MVDSRYATAVVVLWQVVAMACGRESVSTRTETPDVGPVADGGPVSDAGPSANAGDAGAGSDAGSPGSLSCNLDGGLTPDAFALQTSHPASLTQRSAAWLAASDDPQCASLVPSLMATELSWSAPPYCGTDANGQQTCWSWCDTVAVDGRGELGLFSYQKGTTSHFFDVSGASTTIADAAAHQLSIIPRPNDFLLTAYTDATCRFIMPIDPPGALGPAISLVGPQEGFVRNPLGGYVEVGVAAQGLNGSVLQLRWVDESLAPDSDWQPAVNWSGDLHDWQVMIDRTGKALVLSFLYPKSFGAPPPRSEWKFSAHWISENGPLGDPFEPPAPIYTPPSGGTDLFAGWGAIVPLPGGGFVAYQDSDGGAVAPSGWYASYPSGEAEVSVAPQWVQQYDGSLQLIDGDAAFAAIQRDPVTCTRTLQLISASGQLCFTLPLEGSDACSANHSIWPDGTLVLQNVCDFRWWPGIARPGYSGN